MSCQDEIAILKLLRDTCYQPIRAKQAITVGIQSMEKLQEYEQIGTLEEVQDAVEKQKPKKPLYKQGTKYKWIDSVRERGRCHDVEKYSYRDACPNCKCNVLKDKFCCKCGQALDWSEEDD